MNYKDTKLTIRISEDDIQEIDEYLNTNPRFGSRSEFIRHAAIEYIAQSRIAFAEAPKSELKLDKIMEETIGIAVEKGFFNSREDAIIEILNQARKKGMITEIIREKGEEYKSIREELFKITTYDESLFSTEVERRDSKKEKM